MMLVEVCLLLTFHVAVLAEEGESCPRTHQERSAASERAADVRDEIAPDKTQFTDAAKAVRKFQEEIDELEKNAKTVPAEGRMQWELHQCVQLAQKAKQAGCERELLEVLLRAAVASTSDTTDRYLSFDTNRKMMSALAWLVLKKNLPTQEEHLLAGVVLLNEPRDVPGTLTRWFWAPGDLFGAALAAIDSYEDERAKDFLLDVVLTTPKAEKFQAPIEWALRFLTCCDPRAVEPKLRTIYYYSANSCLNPLFSGC